MTMDEGGVWEGRSSKSFAEAAYNAVAKAEEELGDEPPVPEEPPVGPEIPPTGPELSR